MIATLLLLCLAGVANAEHRGFTQFDVDLPEGWDGEETENFLGGNKDSYMLVLGRKDAEGENFLAQVSVFLLPPLDGTPETIAKKMASMQDNVSTPQKEGKFWTFTGEPRTPSLKSPAVTRIRTTERYVLVIIAQDPQALGAESVVASLRGVTPEAKEALPKN
ncbi:MAG: protoporphyrinogen oxidase [Desulfovibrio sp.]|jgi:hypothetical protein|nr:protoporphyrinogen oxidase [Desulfovibrio sp.]